VLEGEIVRVGLSRANGRGGFISTANGLSLNRCHWPKLVELLAKANANMGPDS